MKSLSAIELKGCYNNNNLWFGVLVLYIDTFKNIKLGEIIGERTFGSVYKAIWRGTVVAAKIINIPSGNDSVLKKEIEMCR